MGKRVIILAGAGSVFLMIGGTAFASIAIIAFGALTGLKRGVGRPDRPDESITYRGDEPNLRVVGRIDTDDPEEFTVLVVEEAVRGRGG